MNTPLPQERQCPLTNPDDFPKDGMNYREAMNLWGCSFDQAVKWLNYLITQWFLVPVPGKYGWFQKDPQEMMGDKIDIGKCRHCEKTFRYRKVGSVKEFCKSTCKDLFRAKKQGREIYRRGMMTTGARMKNQPTNLGRKYCKRGLKRENNQRITKGIL